MVKDLESRLQDFTTPLPEDLEIVLDLQSLGYYLVSWSRRRIFWLESVEEEVVTGGVFLAASEAHIGT